MIKAILNSLKNSAFEFSSNALIKFKLFENTIPDSGIYLIYSIRFELDKHDFKKHLKSAIKDMDIFKDDPEFLFEVLKISYNWYTFYTENKKLFSSTSSLKSDMKKML